MKISRVLIIIWRLYKNRVEALIVNISYLEDQICQESKCKKVTVRTLYLLYVLCSMLSYHFSFHLINFMISHTLYDIAS